MWLTLTFWGTACLFVGWALSALWHLRWVRRLPAGGSTAESKTSASRQAVLPPRCSVVIAARDEEARIEQTVRRLLAQRDIELEIIVVDDRSGDRTGAILQHLAAETPQVRVRRVDVLPEGWLGKCHACHLGASAATHDWILFTDGDCWLQPNVIARAMGVVEREGADHLTIVSGISSGNQTLRASHLLFLLSLANWFSGVNRDRRRSFMGIGAFNLVRAAAYRQCGGYEALRLTVVDDMKLGLLLRRAGKRTRAYVGGDDVECHWGDTARNMVKLMEKNYFAAIDYRLGLVVSGCMFVLTIFGVLLLGLISGTAAGLAAALSPFLLVLPAGILAHRLGWSPLVAWRVPLMFPLFLWCAIHSTVVTLRQGGIRWRDTFYPLKALRAGNVR